VVLLNVRVEDEPHIPETDRVEVRPLPQGFYQVLVRYGFKDEPDIPLALTLCEPLGLKYEVMETSFFLGRETIVPRARVARMPRWRQLLFTYMFRNAEPATAFFKIPTNRVVELGTQVEL
jgi:KUP system potassium uptake protein